MDYPSARHSVPAGFLQHCARLGVTDETVLAHLDADSFYHTLDNPVEHYRLAATLLKNQAYPAADIHGVLSMFDIEPERLGDLLAAGLTADTAREYAQRGTGAAELEKTLRHGLDLGGLDTLTKESNLSFRTVAVLRANNVPADFIREARPRRGVPDPAYHLFCEWVGQTQYDCPEDYLSEMFLGEL